MAEVEGEGGGGAPAVASPWVAPEGGAVDPRRGTAPDVGSDATLGGRARPVAEPPPSPVPLRPLGVAGVLDGAFEVLKVRPRVLFGAAAVVVVPTQVFAGVLRGGPYHLDLLTLNLLAEDDAAGAAWSLGSAAAWAAAALEVVATFVVGLVVARTLATWYAGGDPRTWAALRLGVARPASSSAAWVAALLAKVLGAAALVVGVLVPITWFSILAPVLGVERLRAGAALSRSFRLVNRRFGAVLGVVLAVTLVDHLVRFALVALPWLMADGLPDVAAVGVRATATTVASTVSAVFVGAASALLYFDLRVGSEGLDIELEATDAFGTTA